jgi:hypothetical protein
MYLLLYDTDVYNGVNMFSNGLKEIKEHFVLGGIEKIVTSHLKDVKSESSGPSVLILGSPCSGKSTFVNFMMGNAMEEGLSDGGDEILVPKDKREQPCEVSDTPEKTTLYPKFVSSGHKLEEKEFSYIDCAGVPPTDYKETENLASTILTQLAIQGAEKISGVVFLINHSVLSGRALNFAHIFNGLQKSITELSKHAHSILFLVTKAPKAFKESNVTNRLSELASLEQHPGCLAGKTLLNMLSSSYDNLLVFRPTNENHRNLVLSKIQKFKSIPKENFSFPIYDENHLAFKKRICKIANEFYELIKSRDALDKQNQEAIAALDKSITAIAGLGFACMLSSKLLFENEITKTLSDDFEKYKHPTSLSEQVARLELS